MLVYGLDNETCSSFYFFKNLEIKREINKLDISCFEIPKDYRNIFETECKVIENKQSYTIKNIEPFYDGYKIECKQNIDEWLSFFHKSLNFPYKDIETMIKGIIPSGWSYKINGEIKKFRTITADHKSSWEVLEEIVKKFDVEFRIDNNEKIIFISEKIGEDKGAFFSDDFNIVDKDISVESFEFATRIIPEGMNGLKISQINDGKDYLENKKYSGKTITYYWKDERYTNVKNLKDEAAKKLEVLSRPRVSIKLKVKDLSQAIGVYEQEYNVGDYVYLIDKDRKTKERFRILEGTFYPNRPFNNEITLANKPLDLVSDVDENIELTKEMWEETRGRFEATENLIKGYLESSKRYTDDSFKTYKSEREQTDSKIYETITESTTYVDPETGQTKPIIDKQLEIDKTVEGININVYEQKDSLDKLSSQITQTAKEISSKVSKYDFGTMIRQSATDIKFAWNNYSKYIQLEYGSISIYDANVSQSKKRSMFDENGIHFYRDGYYVGKIGTNEIKYNASKKGIVFDLEYEAAFMSWAAMKRKNDNSYSIKWLYANESFNGYSSDTLNAGCDIDMNGHTLRNVKFEGDGISGTLKFKQILQVNSDGTAETWNTCTMKFQNGILVEGSWA